MGWATPYIERLQKGETVQFRPRGNSMTPIIENGELVTCVPVTDKTTLDKGDVVLCRVGSAEYLHKIVAVRKGGYQIGNNRGGINGWVSYRNIFGIQTKD